MCQYLELDPPVKTKRPTPPSKSIPPTAKTRSKRKGGEIDKVIEDLPVDLDTDDHLDDHLDEYTRRRRRRHRREKRERGEGRQDLGSEALNFIDYEKRDLTFIQEGWIENGRWNELIIKSLNFSSYQPFVSLLMYQKKGKWLFWGCEGAILKLIGPGYSSSSPQTSIWCGQGSPFVDKMPTALGITAGANYVRRPIRLNDPKAAPAQVAPDTFDRLKDIQEYNRDPNKGNKGPNWTAYGPGLNPGRSVTNGFKDVLIGQNAREHYVMNHFKNECDIRTAYVAEWSRMGGNVPAPINNQAGQANLYFPHAASDLAKTTSYSSDSKFQSIKAPWVKIDLKPRFLPVKGFKGLVCLDDPFSWNLWISTTTVGKTILTQPNNTWATQPRIQIESMWHLAEVSLESLTPILMQMMFLFLKRHLHKIINIDG